MVSLKPLLFLLLITVSFHAITPDQNQQQKSNPARVQRSVLETGSENNNGNLILAEKRTKRKDPKNDFKYYTGGWNISDHHYFSSVSFTAFPLYGIAAIWFTGFGLFLLVIGCYYCCYRRKIPYGYSRTAYALSLAFLALFTIAAIYIHYEWLVWLLGFSKYLGLLMNFPHGLISHHWCFSVGCVILYTGQGEFHKSTTDTLEFVVRQSKDTVHNLNNVLDILATAKGIGVDQVSLPSDMKNNIDRVDKMINDATRDLDSDTKENEKHIKDVLNSVRLALIIVAAVMLLVALLGFVFSIFGLQVLVYIVMGDTCVAMDEWVQNPTAHTALDDILPCVDNTTAQETVFQSKDVTFQLVEIVNKIINNVANIDPPPFPGFLSYNQSVLWFPSFVTR
ncbi:hypothetical protein OSB04_003879 [Centaurea solstitialis]|uniref:Transmembrane protein n=1 Tax=Centaurea solstitialis TaxID=347529 RepID=A0AA38TVS1_9ASTR|nr:hypothetical protein OSB04_003879 [Centaurea solstitialis]